MMDQSLSPRVCQMSDISSGLRLILLERCLICFSVVIVILNVTYG